MFPKLFDLGPISIYSYGLMLAASYVVALQVGMIRARKRGLNANRVMDLGIYCIISALLGAKLLLVIVDFDRYWQDPSNLLTILRSGGVYYGGFILAAAVGIWFIRRHNLPLWSTCDAFAPGIVLAQAIGRLGCLLAGCCYGQPTSLPWGITFTNPLAAVNSGTPLDVTLHPTQLYESASALIILGVLLVSERGGRSFAGRTFWSYLLLYPATRFLIEFYRGDPRGTFIDILSTSQFISLLLIPVSIVMLFVLGRNQTTDTTRTTAHTRSV